MAKPEVNNEVTLEEAYFFLRTAMWDQEDFKEYIDHFVAKAFEDGYLEGHDYGTSEANEQGWEREYQRGFDQGFEEGYDKGGNEGYKDGYNDAAREEDYNRR